MSLFIANPSKQHLTFYLREPVNNLIMPISVPSGGQAEIGRGWTPPQKEKVIAQLERFGARDAAETHRPMQKFMGLLYRDMGQIEVDEIENGHAALVKTQQERAAREAQYAALAYDRAVNSKGRKTRAARVTGIEVEQEVAPGTRRTGDEVMFSMSVDPDGTENFQLPA